MATVTKTFAFAADAEGFVGTAGASTVTSYDAATGNPAGALSTRTTTRNVAATSYWEWSGTWEDIGVPVGSTVTAVRVDAGYTRCTEFTKATSAGLGPYELRDSAGTLIGTLWAGRTATASDAGWVAIAAQSDLAVPTAQGPSGTTIRLRLADALTTSNATGTGHAITTYDDQVALVITYTAGTSQVVSAYFLALM